EQVRLRCRVHPDAGVGDGEHHVGTGARADVATGVRLIQLDVRRLEDQPAAAGHGVARVDYQIEDHLLELRRIRLHVTERLARHGDQLDVLADQPPEHLRHRAHEDVELQHGGLQNLLATEGQELPGEPTGADGRLVDQVDVPA